MTDFRFSPFRCGSPHGLASMPAGSSAARPKASRLASRRRSAACLVRSPGVQPRSFSFGSTVDSLPYSRTALSVPRVQHRPNPFQQISPSFTASHYLRPPAEARMPFKPARFRALRLVQLRAPCGVETRL